MNRDLLISIVIPVYNVEMYVEKCILSILSQTYQIFELILLNDGSTDRSYDVLLKYIDNPHITIIDKKNTGQSDTRYQGLLMAKGDYVYYVDSDDFLEPYALEKLVTQAQKTDADVVFGRYRLVDGQFNTLREQKKYSIDILEGEKNILRDALSISNFKASLCLKLIKRSLLVTSYCEEIRNIPLNEDVCLSIILASYCRKVVFVNDIIYNVLQRESSISRNIKPTLITINDKIYEIVRNRLYDLCLWNDLSRVFYRGYTKAILYALALAAVKSSSYIKYADLYNLLGEGSLYYSKDLKGNKYSIGSIILVYRVSKFPWLFYRMINIMKPLLKY